MKKIVFTVVLFFSLFSFSQEKKYDKIFVDCENVVSRSSCIMSIIQNQVQEEYIKYRETAVEKYDLEQVQIKYVITKNGSVEILTLKGNFQNFIPTINSLFKKFPRVKPYTENGKSRAATLTDTFYLFPKKK